MKTCWLVTSSFVRTCRSCFEMESLEMKRIVEISWSQWRLGHNINASGRRYGRYQWTTWNLETQARANSATAVWKMLALQLTDSAIRTFVLVAMEIHCCCQTSAALKLSIDFFGWWYCTFLHSEQIHWFAGCYGTNMRACFPLESYIHHLLPRSDSWINRFIIQACGRYSISLLVVTLSDEARREWRRASDCFYTSIPIGYLRDTVMADWVWEKRNVISISYQWRQREKWKEHVNDSMPTYFWLVVQGVREYWDMNQSLIYEVRQHSLLSVLTQLSPLQSHPAQQVALWTFVGFRTTKSFRSFILQANGCSIKAYVLSHMELNKKCWWLQAYHLASTRLCR